jgi:hypothetical protein
MAELVDNRCRCKPLQTPEGGQLSLEVILCRKFGASRLKRLRSIGFEPH